jgi:hypothetical protein
MSLPVTVAEQRHLGGPPLIHWPVTRARWRSRDTITATPSLLMVGVQIRRRLSRRSPEPWSDLARLGLTADRTRPSLERNVIADCWRVQFNNAGAAKEQHYAGVVVRLDDTASGFRAVNLNLTCFRHKSLLSVCGVGCGSRLGPHLFVVTSDSGSLIRAGREHRL